MAHNVSPVVLMDNLSLILDQVVDDQEIVIIRRYRGRDVALISVAQLPKDLHPAKPPRYLSDSLWSD